MKCGAYNHEVMAVCKELFQELVDVALPGAEIAEGNDLGSVRFRCIGDGDGIFVNIETDEKFCGRILHG